MRREYQYREIFMKSKFKKDHYVVVKKAIPKELATFMYNYLLMKEEVLKHLLKDKYISPYETIHGFFGDGQAVDPKAFCTYSDIANETMLLRCQPVLEKHTGLKLVPTYTYSRNYQRGNTLRRHKDRPSCAVSCTLNYGGQPWPIYLDTTDPKIHSPSQGQYKPIGKKGVKVVLKPGDLLIYKGCELEHWREAFMGETCVQAFLHYNIEGSTHNLYDNRPHLGLPAWYKNNG